MMELPIISDGMANSGHAPDGNDDDDDARAADDITLLADVLLRCLRCTAAVVTFGSILSGLIGCISSATANTYQRT